MRAQVRCRRCGGNQFLVKDQYGDYRSCLQCGRTEEIEAPTSLEGILKDFDDSEAPLARATARRGSVGMRLGSR